MAPSAALSVLDARLTARSLDRLMCEMIDLEGELYVVVDVAPLAYAETELREIPNMSAIFIAS
jgi:hypothetical protein